MRAYHNSRDANYRNPYGAVLQGSAVRLAIDIYDETQVQLRCRVWEESSGERLYPMERHDFEGFVRFETTFESEKAGVYWYSFVIEHGNKQQSYYGSRHGAVGGEGVLTREFETSFQLTVYPALDSLDKAGQESPNRSDKRQEVAYLVACDVDGMSTEQLCKVHELGIKQLVCSGEHNQDASENQFEQLARDASEYRLSLEVPPIDSMIYNAFSAYLAQALPAFVAGQLSSREVSEALLAWDENRCDSADLLSALNCFGTDELPHLMTRLGTHAYPETLSVDEIAHYRLSDEERGRAKARLWLLTLMQMTLPGIPCIYAGDELGLEGFDRPQTSEEKLYQVDAGAYDIYRNAIALRRELPFLCDGSFEMYDSNIDDVWACVRTSPDGRQSCITLINRSLTESYELNLPKLEEEATELVEGQELYIEGNTVRVSLRPLGSALVHYHPHVRLAKELQRGSGVLCHITSLPHEGGRGVIGKAAYDFVDMLAEAQQRYWQVLPVSPCDSYGSPYAGPSAFAGNLELLEGGVHALRSQFDALGSNEIHSNPDFTFYREKNESWLLPYALFMAIRNVVGDKDWQQWEEPYRSYSPQLAQRAELRDAVSFYQWAQWQFEQSWLALKSYAHEHEIRIIGDMPIYVSHNSADAWSHPELFQLDEAGYPHERAGAPPDQFAPEGQLWGNPIYAWDVMEEQGYQWWELRLSRMAELYDHVRLDHFVGFDQYYSIPQEKGAQEGRWLPGPGMKLFQRLFERLGPLPVIAEDLGIITSPVRALLSSVCCAGMDVIQFADNDVRDYYRPGSARIAYSSTHDTTTLRGWCAERFGEDGADNLACDLMEKTMASPAILAMFAVQDVLGLGSEARMNTPGVAGGNWSWQLADKQLDPAAFERLRDLTEKYGR
ncbi:MAG: 4-alpha-glucanotransferase [Atopobiaceae bacterium]|nr:4-alpha-glucanotransferase [Atopobiaceae bacterium]